MSKSVNDEPPLDWESLIAVTRRDLELAKLRVLRIEAAILVFKQRKRDGDLFPGQLSREPVGR